MNKLLKGLPASVSQTMVAVLPLLVVIILFVLAGNFGIGKIQEIRTEIKTAQNSQATLTQKLGLLRNYSQTASNQTLTTVSVFPVANSSLTVISQLKTQAITDGVTLSAIKSGLGAPGSGGYSEADITFTVTGTRDQIITFLNDTANLAPITILNTVKLAENSGQVSADVSAKTFWASLPTTIPSLTEPINDLTSSEKDTLAKISTLTLPSFSTGSSPESTFSGSNTNPFGE